MSRVVEAVAGACASTASALTAHFLATDSILIGGTEAQKQEWLPRAASGELLGAAACVQIDGLAGDCFRCDFRVLQLPHDSAQRLSTPLQILLLPPQLGVPRASPRMSITIRSAIRSMGTNQYTYSPLPRPLYNLFHSLPGIFINLFNSSELSAYTPLRP